MVNHDQKRASVPNMERQGSFRHGIVALLPELRAFARFLTRDASRADDLVQEALVRAFASRGQFAADTNLKAWLFTILRNLFYEQARRRKREREILDEYGDQALSLNAHDDASDELSDLNNMLWKLPDAQREALMLVGAQGMSYEEAAAICGVTVGTLRSRVFRGRRFLCELSGGWESVF